MHAILIPVGSHGDVHPFLGLGQELRRRNHEVTLVVNGYFRELAEKLGFDIVELGTREQYLEAMKNPDLWSPSKGFQAVAELGILGPLRRIYQIVEERYRPGETIVAAASLALGARIAHDKLGVPLATVHLQPAIFRSLHQPPKLPMTVFPRWAPKSYVRFIYWLADTLVVDRVLCPQINAFRAELGLPPVRRIMQDWWHSPQRVIAFFPEWYAPPAPDWPPQLCCAGFPLYDEADATPLGDDLEAFLSAGEAPVVFTPGSANLHAKTQFAAVAEALAHIGRRGVLLSRFRENVPEKLPDGVRHFAYAPFSKLLPRSAVLVSHGGIGTVAQGLQAGIPQLVMPLSHDQPDNADRLKRLGVGDALSPKRFRPGNVAAKLKKLLDGAHASRARAVAQKFEGAEARAKAADWLEELHASSNRHAATVRGHQGRDR